MHHAIRGVLDVRVRLRKEYPQEAGKFYIAYDFGRKTIRFGGKDFTADTWDKAVKLFAKWYESRK